MGLFVSTCGSHEHLVRKLRRKWEILEDRIFPSSVPNAIQCMQREVVPGPQQPCSLSIYYEPGKVGSIL